jgi:hypothetical protein
MSIMFLGDAATPSLLGLGDLAQEIDGFFLRAGTNPSSTQISEFLKLYDKGEKRDTAARALIAKGASTNAVSSALNFLDTSSGWNTRKLGGILAIVSAAASGFHGYRRNQSIPWALWWFIMGRIFPIVTPVLAISQGFARAKK